MATECGEVRIVCNEGLRRGVLRELIFNDTIRKHILTMDWQVVTLSNSPVPLLTSDNPVIRTKGLEKPDALLG